MFSPEAGWGPPSGTARIDAWLQQLAPTLAALQSLVLDAATAPETRSTSGMAQFHQAFIHLTAAYVAAMGALQRIRYGDRSAIMSLAIAGQVLAQVGEALRPQWERLIMQADLTARPQLESLRAGLASFVQPLAQVAEAIATFTGPEAWGAAALRAGDLTGYGMA